MSNVMMKCNHASNGQEIDNFGNIKPACCICHLSDINTEFNEDVLKGRSAYCQCGREKNSELQLGFFEYRPDKDYDIFYCGCGSD